MSQLNYYTHSENNIHKNMIIYIGHLATITEGLYLAPASPRLVIHKQVMHRHPNLMHLLIFACGIMDLIPLIACNTTALIPLEGKWCAAEDSVVSGIREGCDHGFQKFYNSYTMIRSERYL